MARCGCRADRDCETTGRAPRPSRGFPDPTARASAGPRRCCRNDASHLGKARALDLALGGIREITHRGAVAVQRTDIDVGFARANTARGAAGFKVRIYQSAEIFILAPALLP